VEQVVVVMDVKETIEVRSAEQLTEAVAVAEQVVVPQDQVIVVLVLLLFVTYHKDKINGTLCKNRFVWSCY